MFKYLSKIFRAFWQTNPVVVFGITLLFGIITFLIALYTPIGTVTITLDYETLDQESLFITKQVGYIYALNWWPVLVIGLPTAIFLALHSIQGFGNSVHEMAERNMFAYADLTAPLTNLDRPVNRFWAVASFFGIIAFVIGFATTALDWYSVVHEPYANNEISSFPCIAENTPQNCEDNFLNENDWSISAIFPTKQESNGIYSTTERPDRVLNYAFSALVYLVAAIEIGIMLSYFAIILSLTLFFLGLSEGGSKVIILPDLKSQDPHHRMGFEVLQNIFQPTVIIAFIGFTLALLMRVQNLFLRDLEHENIFTYLFGDFQEILAKLTNIELLSLNSITGGVFSILDNLANIFDTVFFTDSNSFVGFAAVTLVFLLIALSFYYILRQAAETSKSRILSKFRHEDSASKLEHYYQIPLTSIKEKIAEMESWPLSWPRLRELRNLLLVGLVCFIFFKLVSIWVAYFMIRIIRGEGRI